MKPRSQFSSNSSSRCEPRGWNDGGARYSVRAGIACKQPRRARSDAPHLQGQGENSPNHDSRIEPSNLGAPPLPASGHPLLHSEWRRGTGRGGAQVTSKVLRKSLEINSGTLMRSGGPKGWGIPDEGGRHANCFSDCQIPATVSAFKSGKNNWACAELKFPRNGGQGAENLRKKSRHVHDKQTETKGLRS